jgi:hypothetical protein
MNSDSQGQPQCCTVGLAAAGAQAAVEPVFLNVGHCRWDVEHLVAQRLAPRRHLRTALAQGLRLAVMHPIDLILGQQRAPRTGVALLGAAFALAGTALGPVAAARPIR